MLTKQPILSSLSAALALAGLASAGSCGVTYYRPPAVAVKQQTIVKEVVPVVTPVAVYAPVVAVPAYAAVYTPPAVPAPEPAKANELAQILTAVQGVRSKIDDVGRRVNDLDARLRAVEGKAASPQPSGPAAKPTDRPDPFAPKSGALSAPRPAAIDVFQARCAVCHESKVSADKGGGFTLLEGAALAKLDDRQARKVLSQSYSGRMPPRGHDPLTDEEVGMIAAFIDSIK